jgi:teichuronic acid biosynthesis glycosyltransferase TuaC
MTRCRQCSPPPTRWRWLRSSEGLANAWLEALASGTPMVIPDIGGARQVVRSDTGGRIVARTPEALAAALATLIATPPDPAEVRATVEPFTWAANSARLHAFLQRIVAERRNAVAA